MSTQTLSAREFLRTRKGSLREHEDRVRALLDYCALNDIPAVPIHTGPRVAPRAGGQGFDLRANPLQRGFGDVVLCLPPWGRLALIDVKTGAARLSPEQQRMHWRFARTGALCLVLRDVLEIEPIITAARQWARTGAHQGGPR